MRRGASLALHRSRLPRYIHRLLQQGLVCSLEERDLDLQEVRDMLLVTRREAEDAVARRPPRRRLRSELARVCGSAL